MKRWSYLLIALYMSLHVFNLGALYADSCKAPKQGPPGPTGPTGPVGPPACGLTVVGYISTIAATQIFLPMGTPAVIPLDTGPPNLFLGFVGGAIAPHIEMGVTNGFDIGVSGTYEILYGANLKDTGATIAVVKNGNPSTTGVILANSVVNTGTGNNPAMSTVISNLNAGDFIQLYVLFSPGGSATLQAEDLTVGMQPANTVTAFMTSKLVFCSPP